MTIEQSANPERKSLRRFVPWLVAAAALAVYLWTLDPWVSRSNLLQVARTSGWTWQDELAGPLYWLVIYPLRWLPVRLIPVAVNLFSTLCAVLSLALLARSVMLLPHDRTHEQRQNEKSEFSLLSIRMAWLPPVLAALVCGLQITFWQNATVAGSTWPAGSSNEMFDLLLFAYILRCVLESRIDEERPWLTRASFVYGLSITNNWAMIGFFPLFLTALVWIRGLAFFNPRFLGRVFLWGLAGLLLYLLLPLVQSMADISKRPFWEGLTENLKTQRYALATLPFNKQRVLSGAGLWVVGLSSLLPVLMMSIRWPSSFGDPSRIGVAISTFVLQVAHAALLLLCVWVALGSALSPNHLLWVPGLTFYYLGALSIGYFAGYFLLVFNNPTVRSRRTPGCVRLTNNAVQVAVWLLLFLVPALLVARNLPQIREANGPMFRQYAAALAQKAPQERTVFLSDDPVRLFLLRSFFVRNESSQNYLFVETKALDKLDYHRFLLKKHPGRWPVDLRYQELYSSALVQLLGDVAASNQVYYLHPSFGFFFEAFYHEPHGMVYQLNAYPTNVLLAPPLSEAVLDGNEAFWAKVREDALEPLLGVIAPATPRKTSALMEKAVKKLHLVTEPNGDAALLGTLYSSALVAWGDELQKSGRYAKAAGAFELAQQLNPDNVVATINLACNKSLQAGTRIPPIDPKSLEDQFGKYRTWGDVINANGPFDDPGFCFEQGRVFARGGLYRQAANQFARAKTLAPGNLHARLMLAQIYLMGRMPDEALKLVKEIHAQPDVAGLGRTNRAALLSVETSALLAKNDLTAAEAAIQAAAKEYPGADDLLSTVADVFIRNGRYTNALPYLDQQIKIAPNNPAALRAKGYVFLQTGAFTEAIDPLTRVLALETNKFAQDHVAGQTNKFSREFYETLLNRAIAYRFSDRLEEAKSDYEGVRNFAPRMFQIFDGLGEIAWRQHDTNAAIKNYQLYLSNSPDNPEEVKTVKARLKELNAGSP
jgi:tetratricopeptide (TPR) repeat protein